MMKIAERLLDVLWLIIGGAVIVGLLLLIAQHIALASAEPTEPPTVKEPVVETTAPDKLAMDTLTADKPVVTLTGTPVTVPQDVWEQIVERLHSWTPKIGWDEMHTKLMIAKDIINRAQAKIDHAIESAIDVIEAGNDTPEAVDYVALAIEAGYAQDAEYMAKMLFGEDHNGTKEHQAGCCWTVLNRLDDPRWPDTIKGVITARNQFSGYSPYHPVDPEMYELALDVIGRWLVEKDGAEDVGRVLPREYLYFTGDGRVNTFTAGGVGRGVAWDWSLPDPYEGSAQ